MSRPKAGPWAETSVLTVAVFLVLACWSFAAPLFTTVDEPRHINSVVRLMEGGGWPAPGKAPMLEATERAGREAGHPVYPRLLPGAKKAPGEPVVAPDHPVAPGDRSSLGGVKGTPPGIVPHSDWMNQHPPGYYAAVAAPLALVGADDWRWDHAIIAMRLISCLFTAAAIPFVMAAGRLLTGCRSAGMVAGSSVLLIPQWFNTSSLVTNDSLLIALGAAVLYAGVRAMTKPETLVSSSLVGGVALGLGLLTKGLMLTAIPVLAIFLLLAGRRAGNTLRHRLWIPLSAGGIAFVIGGWWWLRNMILFGTLQPSVYGSGRNPEPSPVYSLSSYAARAARRLMRSFWGSSRETLMLPFSLVVIASLVAAVVVIAGVMLSRHRLALLLTFLYPALVLALTVHHSWEVFWNVGRIQGVQGRYLFGGIIALAGCVATVWAALLRGRRAGGLMVVGWSLLVLIATIGGWVFATERRWPDGMTALLDQEAVPRFVPVVIGVAALLAVLAALAALWRLTRQEAESPAVAGA